MVVVVVEVVAPSCLGRQRKNRWLSGEASKQFWGFSSSVPPTEDKTAKAEAPLAPGGSPPAADGTLLPPGHPAPSQGTASKCPFLAAQMGQQGSSVFRKASLELQEDVQEMQAVRTGNRGRAGKREAPVALWDPRARLRAAGGRIVLPPSPAEPGGGYGKRVAFHNMGLSIGRGVQLLQEPLLAERTPAPLFVPIVWGVKAQTVTAVRDGLGS